jgi:hypothetical protein
MPDVWTSVRTELLAMAENDLRLRTELEADGSLFQGYHLRMRALHDANAARLGAILDDHGWPGEPQVGREGAKAAWLIAQHAIAQPSLQRRALIALQSAVQRGDVPALYAAMLEDRIRCFEGRPQRYGTQFDWDVEGRMSPLPLEDPDAVDALRKEVGLGPLALDISARRAALADGPDRPPPDWAARQREMEVWYREVGWRA